jgi:hypothetical protein
MFVKFYTELSPKKWGIIKDTVIGTIIEIGRLSKEPQSLSHLKIISKLEAIDEIHKIPSL